MSNMALTGISIIKSAAKIPKALKRSLSNDREKTNEKKDSEEKSETMKATPKGFGRPAPHQVHWEPLYRPAPDIPTSVLSIPRASINASQQQRKIFLDGPVFSSRKAPKGGLPSPIPSPKMRMKFPLNPKDTIHPPRDNNSDKENQHSTGSRAHSRQPSNTGSQFSLPADQYAFKRKKSPAPRAPGSPSMVGSRRPSITSYLSMSSTSEGLIRKKRRAPPPPSQANLLKEGRPTRAPGPPVPLEPPRDYEMSDDEERPLQPVAATPAPPPPPTLDPTAISKSKPPEKALSERTPPKLNNELKAAIIAAAEERSKRIATIEMPEKRKTFHEMFSEELNSAITKREERRQHGGIVMRQTSFRKYYKATTKPIPPPEVSVQDKIESGMKEKIKEPDQEDSSPKDEPTQVQDWVPADDLHDDDNLMDGPDLNQALTARGTSNIPTYFHIFTDPSGEEENGKRLYKKNGPVRSHRANPSKNTLKRFKQSLKGVIGSVGKSFGKKKDLKDNFDQEWEIYYAEDYDEPPDGPIQVDHIEKQPAYAYNPSKGQLVLLPQYERIIVTKDGRHIRESAVTKNYKPPKRSSIDEPIPDPVIIELDVIAKRDSELEESRKKGIEIDAKFEEVRRKIKARRPHIGHNSVNSMILHKIEKEIEGEDEVQAPPLPNSPPPTDPPEGDDVKVTKSILNILEEGKKEEENNKEQADDNDDAMSNITKVTVQGSDEEEQIAQNPAKEEIPTKEIINKDKPKQRKRRSRSRSAVLGSKGSMYSSDEDGNDDSEKTSSGSGMDKIQDQERLNDSGYRTDASMSVSSNSPVASPMVPPLAASGVPQMMSPYGMGTPAMNYQGNPMMFGGGFMPQYNPMAFGMNQPMPGMINPAWQTMNNPYMWNPAIQNPYMGNFMNPIAMGMSPPMSPYASQATTPMGTLERNRDMTEVRSGGTTINIMYPNPNANPNQQAAVSNPNPQPFVQQSGTGFATDNTMTRNIEHTQANPVQSPSSPVPQEPVLPVPSPTQNIPHHSESVQKEIPTMSFVLPPPPPPTLLQTAPQPSSPTVPSSTTPPTLSPKPKYNPLAPRPFQPFQTSTSFQNGPQSEDNRQRELITGPIGFRPINFNPNVRKNLDAQTPSNIETPKTENPENLNNGQENSSQINSEPPESVRTDQPDDLPPPSPEPTETNGAEEKTPETVEPESSPYSEENEIQLASSLPSSVPSPPPLPPPLPPNLPPPQPLIPEITVN